MRLIYSYLIGMIFGTGIAVSGMANPAKVLNFFDLAGHWDPSLAFVMAGALLVTFIGYRLVIPRGAPLFDSSFHLPKARQIDPKLVGGAAIFGLGWGISGFCPGGALPALGVFHIEVWLFVGAMTAGMALTRWISGVKG
jgi:uncharacterized protein